MKERFAEWLRLALSQQKWSAARLAQKIGVSRSTAQRWAKAETFPHPKQIQAIFTALKVTSEDQATIRRELGLPSDHTAPIYDAPKLLAAMKPNPSDLLQTIRRRKQLKQEQVAINLGVSTSTISRAEGAVNLPLTGHQQKLLRMYEATPDEEKALSIAPHRLGVLPPAEAMSMDDCEQELALLEVQVDQEIPILGDLRFLLLEAALWSHALHAAAVLPFLRRTYHFHAEWLLRRGRFSEMGRYAHRALDLIPTEGRRKTDLLLGVGIAAKYADEGVGKSDPWRAYKVLEYYLPLAERAGQETHIYHGMAQYACAAHQFTTALALSERALETAQRLGNPSVEYDAKKVKARVLLSAGNAPEALSLLEVRDEVKCPNQQVFNAFQWAETLQAVGKGSEADEWLRVAERVIQQYEMAHIRHHLERISQR